MLDRRVEVACSKKVPRVETEYRPQFSCPRYSLLSDSGRPRVTTALGCASREGFAPERFWNNGSLRWRCWTVPVFADVRRHEEESSSRGPMAR